MKRKLFSAGWLVLSASVLQAAAPGGKADHDGPAVSGAARVVAPALRVKVDPRVELFSLIFRLAGNPEYNQARVRAYSGEVEEQFGTFREHAAIKLATRLRNGRGVSYDACMGMAIHVADAETLRLRVPLEPWPESLDGRWTAADASSLLAEARQFVRDSGFREFITKHRALYESTETRLRQFLERQAHLEWFNSYFGERPRATFTVIPGLLNGGCCYGAHLRPGGGQEELYCILGVWQTDAQGLPEFGADVLDTVVHEFAHSYANPLVDRRLEEFREAGQVLFDKVAARMRSQAYGQPATMVRESLVRACVIRYLRQHQGPEAAQQAIEKEKKRGFLWMQELSELLAEYEAHRDRYPTFDGFASRLVAFFKEYAKATTSRVRVEG